MPDPKTIIRQAAERFELAAGGHCHRDWCEFHAATLRTLLDGVVLKRETAREILEDAEDVERRGWDLPARYETIRRQLDEEPKP